MQPHRHLAMLASLVILLLPGCMIIQHLVDQRPSGAPNLELADGMIWRQAGSSELNRIWTDPDGTRIRFELQNGIGFVHVESEEARFFWDKAEVLVRGETVQVKRKLGGDKVDGFSGRLDVRGSEGTGVLVIDFGERGVWQREGALELGQDWLEGSTPIRLEHKSGDRYVMHGAPDLGWSVAEGWIRGNEAQFDVRYRNGTRKSVNATMKVGVPKLPENVTQLVPVKQ